MPFRPTLAHASSGGPIRCPDARHMAVLTNPTFAQIRERAYELRERSHRPDGLEVRFWLAA